MTSRAAAANLGDRLAARSRARRNRLLGALAALLALGCLLAAAWFTPLLAIKQVRTTGTGFYSAEEIRAAVLTDWADTPLPQAMPAAVADTLRQRLPKAAAVRVSWAGPRTLRVAVTDRTPLIAVRSAEGWQRVDATGTTIDTQRDEPADLARLELPAGADRKATVAAVLRLLAALPEGTPAEIAVVRAADAESIELDYTGSGSSGNGGSGNGGSGSEGTGRKVTIRFGSAEDAARKFDVAAALIPTGAARIDVSVPEVPVTS